MLRNGNSRVAFGMSLGLVFGGYLALDDRAQRNEAAPPDKHTVVVVPDPETELLPPLLVRNHRNDLGTAAVHT